MTRILPRLTVLAALTLAAAAASGCASGAGAGAEVPERYAPAAAPPGTALCAAGALPADPGLPVDPDHEVTTVWGDASLPDPWRGPLAVITERDGDAYYEHDGATPVRVGGHPADVAPIPVFQGVSSASLGHIVTWRTSATRVVEITARDATAAQAVALAEKVGFTAGRPTLAGDALGPRTAVIHAATAPAPPGDTWSVLYSGPEAGGSGLLTVDGVPTTPDDLEILRLYSIASGTTTVAGRPGVRLTRWDPGKGPFTLAWHTADGQTVTVTGLGLSEAQVTAAVASIRRLSAGEWQALVDGVDPGACAAPGSVTTP